MTRGAVFVGGAQQFGVAIAADAADREGRADHQGDAGERRQPRRHEPTSLPLQNLRLVAQPRQPLSWKSNWGSAQEGRTLPRMSNAQRTPVVPLEAGAGPENPPCPACGEPLFGWLAAAARPATARSAAARAAGSASSARRREPEEALRELDRLGDEERRRGSPTAPASPPRSAAPAGPGWSPAPATSSRSSRCGGWSPAATRSSSRSRWAPLRRPRRDLADDAEQRHLRPQRRPGRARARPGRRRPSSAGSGGSTPWPASSWRSRRC